MKKKGLVLAILAGICIFSLGCAVQGSTVSGPELGKPGRGPVIDKSGDAVLSQMIQEVAPEFKTASFTDNKTGQTLQYALFAPKDKARGKRYPLVLFMADASTAGRDVSAPLTQGYGGVIWASQQAQAKNPCYVLVPQFSGVAVNDAYQRLPEVDALPGLIAELAAAESIDPARVYATGQSMGGMISAYLNVAYPDLFAASILVDCHWDKAVYDQLAMHKLIYITAGDHLQNDIDALEEAARKDGKSYTYASWSAKLPQATQDDLAQTMLAKGAPINIFNFEPGTVLPENGQGSEHMYSFDYAWRLAPCREWLFKQSR